MGFVGLRLGACFDCPAFLGCFFGFGAVVDCVGHLGACLWLVGRTLRRLRRTAGRLASLRLAWLRLGLRGSRVSVVLCRAAAVV